MPVMNHPNKEIMQRAIELAKAKYKEGGHAVAAIIVKGDKIIAEAFTTIIKEKDPTCHAEMNAIRLASKVLGNRVLADCYLYTTFEPCPMCTTACVWARMKGIVFGANMDDETEKCHQRIKIHAKEVLAKGEPKLELHENFMREECRKLLYLE